MAQLWYRLPWRELKYNNCCDQILEKQSNSHIRQIKLTPLHYVSANPQHCSNYSKVSLTDVFSGKYGRLKWQCLGLGRAWLQGISGELVNGLIQLAICWLCGFCCISATKEAVQSHNSVYGIWKCTPLLTLPSTSLWTLVTLSNRSDFLSYLVGKFLKRKVVCMVIDGCISWINFICMSTSLDKLKSTKLSNLRFWMVF